MMKFLIGGGIIIRWVVPGGRPTVEIESKLTLFTSIRGSFYVKTRSFQNHILPA